MRTHKRRGRRVETADLYLCETETITADGMRYRSNVETFEHRAS